VGLPTPPTDIAIPVQGGSLNVARFRGPGQPAGPAVIAVHGITANSRAWGLVAATLGGRAELVAVDLRGRGGSRDLPGPYGFDAHEADLLAALDALELSSVVLTGHSLGAYVVARFAERHPERVRAALLLDGGLPIPGFEGPSPTDTATTGVAAALARFSLHFATLADYVDWWRRHPAFAGGQADDAALASYAAHDLSGAEPELRPTASAAAIEADALELARAGSAAARLETPARMLVAPRGLLGEPSPMQPLEQALAWASADPARRSAALVPDVNHYTLVLGRSGAAAVADAIAELV